MRSPDSSNFSPPFNPPPLKLHKPVPCRVTVGGNKRPSNFSPKILSHSAFSSRGYGSVPENLIAPSGQKLARASPVASRKTCNCKRSNCLKLYCECFASGQYCVNCNCTSCYNNYAGEVYRKEAIRLTLERNSTAFRPKIAPQSLPSSPQFSEPRSAKHSKGCACKRSNCLKKYCECFNAGVSCSENCKCVGCMNRDGLEFAKGKNCHEYWESVTEVDNQCLRNTLGLTTRINEEGNEAKAMVGRNLKDKTKLSLFKDNSIIRKEELKEIELEGKKIVEEKVWKTDEKEGRLLELFYCIFEAMENKFS